MLTTEADFILAAILRGETYGKSAYFPDEVRIELRLAVLNVHDRERYSVDGDAHRNARDTI